MSMEQRILQITQLVAAAIIVVSCYLVLRVSFAALLFAAVVCISTWPLYLHLRRLLRQKSTLAALVMVLLIILLVITPSALLAYSLVGNMATIIDAANQFLAKPLLPPVWLKQLPLFGESLDEYWRGVVSGGDESKVLFVDLLEPARKFLLNAAMAIGQSVLQMSFAAFIVFFLYRDGDALLQRLRDGLTKLVGGIGEDLLLTIHNTVAGVVRGIFGAALAQASVATAGFLIAGVPGAVLLGVITFFLSILPIGPPMVWGAASIWLYSHGSYGWAIFMVLWGVFAISSIDNLVRPYLISYGSHLSLLLIVLGVTGGIAAFGFIGIFIGPPILAVSLTLVRLWTVHPVKATENNTNV